MSDDRPTRRPLAVGALAGLVAALAMTLVQALLRLGLGVPSPAELIGDRLGERVPVKPFLNLIGRIGSYGRLKALSVFGVLAVTLVLGAVVGALYARITERRPADPGQPLGRLGLSRRGLVVLALVVFVAWLLSVAAFWPLLASYYRGAPRGSARLANAGWLLFAYAVFAATLIGAYRLLTARPAAGVAPSASGAGLGRRAVLTGGAGVGLAVATGGVLTKLYTRSTFGYDGLQNNGDLTPITPNDRFYVVTQNLIDPRVHKGSWRLEIGGEVERPRHYDFAAISALPSVVQESTLTCISNGVGGGLMANAAWKGVPLRQLLAEAAPRANVRDVVFHGVDGYTDTFPLAKAMDPTTLVAYEMNGQPLPLRHGFPVRIIVPGLYGEKNVKWIDRIQLSATNEQGFYENQGWGPDFVVQTQSRFTAPDSPARCRWPRCC
ncbi:MAG: molybdopterin-dependent oxidoreductase [Acidimicrobiales bacterium]